MAMASVTESCNQREKNKRKLSRNERARRGHGCLTSTRNETKRGELGRFAWSSTRPDSGRFIANAIHTGQVLYGITGELKGEIESTNGARVWKMSLQYTA